MIDNKIKVVLLGDSGVGKTSIAKRLTNNSYSNITESTIGASYFSCNLNNKYNLDIWDTAGQERYKSLAPMYYRGADIAYIVYDITNIESYNTLRMWASEVKQNSECQEIVIIGNKIDLEYSQSKINKYDVKEFSTKNKYHFYEVSAKTGENINNTFVNTAKLIKKKKSNKNIRLTDDNSIRQKKKQKCC